MAKFNDPQPWPDLQVYDWEGAFQNAFAVAVESSAVMKPFLQGNDRKLTTPRIEGKFILGEQVQKSYIVPGTDSNFTAVPAVASLTVVADTNSSLVNLEAGGSMVYWISYVTALGETFVGNQTSFINMVQPMGLNSVLVSLPIPPANVTAIHIWRTTADLEGAEYDMGGFPAHVSLLATVAPGASYKDFESNDDLAGRDDGAKPVKASTIPKAPWRYPHLWQGQFVSKIVTSRKDDAQKEPLHSRFRGLVRLILQDHINQISARMKFHSVVQIIDRGTTPTFDQSNEENISGLSHSVVLSILESAFPKPS